jgi:hypothetical protein
MMTGIGDGCDPEMCSQIVCKEEEKGKSEGLAGRQLRGHNGGDIVPLIVKVQDYKRLYPLSAATR